jgi:hypothetical protein
MENTKLVGRALAHHQTQSTDEPPGKSSTVADRALFRLREFVLRQQLGQCQGKEICASIATLLGVIFCVGFVAIPRTASAVTDLETVTVIKADPAGGFSAPDFRVVIEAARPLVELLTAPEFALPEVATLLPLQHPNPGGGFWPRYGPNVPRSNGEKNHPIKRDQADSTPAKTGQATPASDGDSKLGQPASCNPVLLATG